MPRVANPPQGHGRTVSRQMATTPHKQASMKIPLNDDRVEKAARLQSRQALHDIQMNQIRAAASPMRQLKNYERAGSTSPRTPRSVSSASKNRPDGKENDPEGGIAVVSGAAATPMKRVPILANFEEWMKMATDNKINANNSWNFALIDYFHDMSLLKEGDGVNFQKASCTLDGCVKIYTSRVDSVATETGKLLSGLADSGNKKAKENKDGEGEDGEDEEEEEGEDGVKRKTRKKAQRSHESTLVPSFASLQLKKLELEFAVDPLFKKASADFDEGGAKGLLLNHLAIDSEGRIVFDSSDDSGDATAAEATGIDSNIQEVQLEVEQEPEQKESNEDGADIDLSSLAAKFFPDLSILGEQDICPSLKDFSLGDPSSSLDIPFLKAPEEWQQHDKPQSAEAILAGDVGEKTGMFSGEGNAGGFDDEDDGVLGGFDLPPETGFGEGGEAWAKDAALEPMLRVHRVDDDGRATQDGQDGVAVGDFDPSDPNQAYAVSLNHAQRAGDEHENILSYFDNALKANKSWAGPEHWRIRRIKDTSSTSAAPARQRKEKEPFEIDFLSPMDQSLADMIYTPATSNSAISLPKSQWKTKGRNLLPDDKHFNSRSLLSLFLKPKARLGSRRNVPGLPPQEGASSNQNAPIDPAYWAAQRPDIEPDEVEAPKGDYDANFFADDDGLPFSGGLPDLGDDDDNEPLPFMDAREALSPPPDGSNPSAPTLDGVLASSSQDPSQQPQNANMLPGSFGSQLVTQGGRRMRPEYVNYARTAKKVDVRKLKENMWTGMSASLISAINSPPAEAPPTPAPSIPEPDPDAMDIDSEPPAPQPPQKDAEGESGGEVLKFTSLMSSLKNVYPQQQLKDISTSYCFICLLHLANEKGLVLEGERERMMEILVRRDGSVGEDYEGE
ncbi:MAG: hypothetical protein Q9160_005778 [Pyrenula sp. 1 TL-2023]